MKHVHKLNVAGLLIALGIIYGDIGTSPLYVLKAIIGDKVISDQLVLGGFSCIFWTLTLQTSLKYIYLALQADNKGEGGVFSLFTLVRRWNPYLIFPAIIGGAALLADGVITPCISVMSAIEGLTIINPHIPVIPIVLIIITGLFSVQQFGTKVVGTSFGPIILVWFMTLAVLGIYNLLDGVQVLKAINPLYAYDLLVNYPQGFWLLGAVFLCTTGAEAMYSDLGHCGKENIRVTWIFVKIALILNYAGQSAWLLKNAGKTLDGQNPFFAVMPAWFIPWGIGIATLAAIIASQALITGAFTLITEAMRLRLFPKVRVFYPTELRGQIYVPVVNLLLFIGCVSVVLVFKTSSAMEAIYGLSINIIMLSTTILLTYFLSKIRVNKYLIIAFALVYFSIELAFLVANLSKFFEGGWFTIIIGAALFLVMRLWYNGSELKKKFTEFEDFRQHLPLLRKLSTDTSVGKYATNLIYLTEANKPFKIEKKIIYSLFQRIPKRADVYWFIHVHVLDEPYKKNYSVETLIPGIAYRIDFHLGFKVDPRISQLFRSVITDMAKNDEIDMLSRYTSLRSHNITGDFRFIVLRKFFSGDNVLAFKDKVTMKAYFLIKKFLALSEETGFGLDTSSVVVETFPMILATKSETELVRINPSH